MGISLSKNKYITVKLICYNNIKIIGFINNFIEIKKFR